MVNENNSTRPFFLVYRCIRTENLQIFCFVVDFTVKWKKDELLRWEPEDLFQESVFQPTFQLFVSEFRSRRLSRHRKRNKINNILPKRRKKTSRPTQTQTCSSHSSSSSSIDINSVSTNK